MPISSSPVRYLLDTKICIYIINARPPAVLARFMAHEIDGLGISAITASELAGPDPRHQQSARV